MQKIHPFLWFDTQAEEAANLYVSIFKNSKITSISRYPEGGPVPKDRVMTVGFELEGQQFTALNAGPHFKFNEAISFVVACRTQDEIDQYWSGLSAGGGSEGQCGWLKDKYGLSWQIVPANIAELTKDPARANRVMQAVLGMKKLDMAELERAAKAA